MTGTTRKTPNIWWLTLVTGMASYIDSAAIVTSGIAIVMLKETLGLGAAEQGILSSVLTFSIAIGAAVGGRLGDRFGRRKVFLVTMLVVTLAALTLCLAPSYPVYLTGIILIGFGTGADLPVSLASIAEAAGKAQRGRMISFTQIQWKLGVIVSQALGVAVGDLGRTGAQVMYGHIAIIAALTLIARFTIPESARWQKAHVAVKLPTTAQPVGSLRDLLRRPYLGAFLGLITFYSLINLGMNTNGQFGALIFTQVAGASVSFYSTVGLITTVVGFLLVFVLMKVIDGPHRMAWFVTGAACGVTGSLLPAIFGPTTITLTAMLVLWSLASVFAGEPLMKLWAQESFPTLLRSTAQGAIISFARAAAAVLALVTPLVLAAGPRILFGSIALVAFIGTSTAFLIFRGRTSTEIERDDAVVLPAIDDAGDQAKSTTPAQSAKVGAVE